jgi:hypothetical protein
MDNMHLSELYGNVIKVVNAKGMKLGEFMSRPGMALIFINTKCFKFGKMRNIWQIWHKMNLKRKKKSRTENVKLYWRKVDFHMYEVTCEKGLNYRLHWLLMIPQNCP